MFTLFLLGLVGPFVVLTSNCSDIYYTGGNRFCTVSLSSLHSESCVTLSGVATTYGMAYDVTNGKLYIIGSELVEKPNRKLYEYNITQNILTEISSNTMPDTMSSLASTCNGTLYGVGGSVSGHDLYQIDKTNGNTSLVLTLTDSSHSVALTYDTLNNELYRVYRDNGYQIEHITLDPLIVGITVTMQDPPGLSIVGSAGFQYGSRILFVDQQPKLISVDVSSGQDYVIGDIQGIGDTIKGIVCTDYLDNYISCAPSINPTSVSFSPTTYPSLNPTTDTNNPTLVPTNYPSINPTLNPSNNPSKTPSNNPSNTPSISPTLLPSNHPSNDPSMNPTSVPSSDPSKPPTNNPIKANFPTSNPTGGNNKSNSNLNCPSNTMVLLSIIFAGVNLLFFDVY